MSDASRSDASGPDVVDGLLARPGLYVGTSSDPTGEHGSSAARIEVDALPGGSGVYLRYEVLSTDDGVVHDERAMLARAAGGLVLVTAHSHADITTVITETEPGYFPAADDAPFPTAIRIEVPEPGHLVYSWSYGMPGEELVVRDVGDLRHVG
jgi:hypothetical protein